MADYYQQKKRWTIFVYQLLLFCTSILSSAAEINEEEVSRFRAYIRSHQAEHENDRPFFRRLFSSEAFLNPPFLAEDEVVNDRTALVMEMLEAWRAPTCTQAYEKVPLFLRGELHECSGCILERQKAFWKLSEDKIHYAHEGLAQEDSVTVKEFAESMGVDFVLLKKEEPFLSKPMSGIENAYLDGAAGAFVTVLDDLTDIFRARPHISSEKFSLEKIKPEFDNYSFQLFKSQVIGLFMALSDPENEMSEKLLMKSKSDSPFTKVLKKARNASVVKKINPADLELIEKNFNVTSENVTFGEVFETHKELLGIYLSERKDALTKDLGIPLELSEKAYQFMLELYQEDRYEEMDNFVSDLRDLSMATNIAKEYCEKSLKNQKPLLVQFGAIHGQAVSYLLKRELKNVPVDYRNIAKENLEKSAEEYEADLDAFLKSVKQ